MRLQASLAVFWKPYRCTGLTEASGVDLQQAQASASESTAQQATLTSSTTLCVCLPEYHGTQTLAMSWVRLSQLMLSTAWIPL